ERMGKHVADVGCEGLLGRVRVLLLGNLTSRAYRCDSPAWFRTLPLVVRAFLVGRPGRPDESPASR
ncbi:hypothetical protein DF153_34805, partial [Burkholderia cenocepacia]